MAAGTRSQPRYELVVNRAKKKRSYSTKVRGKVHESHITRKKIRVVEVLVDRNKRGKIVERFTFTDRV